MATDNIKYPLRYELLRSSRGGILALINADEECVMTCDDTSDFEMQHVVTRLNLASATIAKMKMMGWIVDETGNVVNARLQRSFEHWDDAIDYCIEEACS